MITVKVNYKTFSKNISEMDHIVDQFFHRNQYLTNSNLFLHDINCIKENIRNQFVV